MNSLPPARVKPGRLHVEVSPSRGRRTIALASGPLRDATRQLETGHLFAILDSPVLREALPPQGSRRRRLSVATLSQVLTERWREAIDFASDDELEQDTLVVIKAERFSGPSRLGTFLVPSSSLRELENLERARAHGAPTFRPLLAAEVRRAGLLAESFLVTVRVAGGMNLSQWFHDPSGKARRDLPPERLKAALPHLLQYVARLHRRRFYARTLFTKNVHAVPDDRGEIEFFLHDLPRAVQCSPRGGLSLRRAAHDLASLDRQGCLWLRRGERLRWLQVYLAELDEGPPLRVWLRAIARQRRRFLRQTLPSWAMHWTRRRLKQIPGPGRWFR